MQLIPRYLVTNRISIVANEAGFVTEYKPVYNRQVKVFTGIDNTLQFRALNADQKPINIANYTPKFVAFDENNKMVISHDGVTVTGDDSAATRGLFNVVITENDLLNIKQQYLSYNIYLVDSSGNKTLTYTHSHFEGCGTIYVDTCQFPGPAPTHEVATFRETSADKISYYFSETISAEPAINGNEALHTAAVYTENYVGNVIVQATLDNQVSDGTQWADIKTLEFDGTETQPKPVNFNGVFSHLRFQATENPANKITKILVRN